MQNLALTKEGVIGYITENEANEKRETVRENERTSEWVREEDR